jgi:hypothetical protein
MKRTKMSKISGLEVGSYFFRVSGKPGSKRNFTHVDRIEQVIRKDGVVKFNLYRTSLDNTREVEELHVEIINHPVIVHYE